MWRPCLFLEHDHLIFVLYEVINLQWSGTACDCFMQDWKIIQRQHIQDVHDLVTMDLRLGIMLKPQSKCVLIVGSIDPNADYRSPKLASLNKTRNSWNNWFAYFSFITLSYHTIVYYIAYRLYHITSYCITSRHIIRLSIIKYRSLIFSFINSES